MPRHRNSTSFKKGLVPWNKKYDSPKGFYAAHRHAILTRTRARNVQVKYGISLQEYEQRKLMQGNLCALCGEPMIETKTVRGTDNESPVLDHNHRTAQLRGFVHRRCNVAIGLMKEDPEKLRRAADYLERYTNASKCDHAEIPAGDPALWVV